MPRQVVYFHGFSASGDGTRMTELRDVLHDRGESLLAPNWNGGHWGSHALVTIVDGALRILVSPREGVRRILEGPARVSDHFRETQVSARAGGFAYGKMELYALSKRGPLTLVGHSLGTEFLAYAIQGLRVAGGGGLPGSLRIVLLGGTLDRELGAMGHGIPSSLGKRLVNVHSTGDNVLRKLFSAAGYDEVEPCGLHTLKSCPGSRNICVNWGHTAYLDNMDWLSDLLIDGWEEGAS